MKGSIFKTLTFTLALLASITVVAQQSGIVTYQKIVDYGIEPNGTERWDNFIKDLPKAGTFVYTLTFKDGQSLFQEDASKKGEISPLLQRALGGAARFNPPKVKVLQTYQNLDKAETIEQWVSKKMATCWYWHRKLRCRNLETLAYHLTEKKLHVQTSIKLWKRR